MLLSLAFWFCMQVCLYGGTPADPDERDRYPHSTSVSLVDGFIQKHFRGVSRNPAIVEFCMFTMTVSGCDEYDLQSGRGETRCLIHWIWLVRGGKLKLLCVVVI